ncbi:hypothetical protein [Roseicella aerolata]|uniref:Sel1 repeat-containing protein n=1 Tax=Roseicella aerolata TaxID=2883479 RepID=A0A9X1IDV9_9PROT|nr:hypothetical protein [Roseicella aerolata]MCB4822966.1 hypothetical protein [Roseicella aerolata]
MIRDEVPPQPAAGSSRRDYVERTLREVLAAMPSGWGVLRDAALPGWDGGPPARIGTLLVHPEVGIAVLDLLPGPTVEDAAARLRRLLEKYGWGTAFGGLPPVVHLCMPLRALPELEAYLGQAFSQAPPPILLGGNWVAALPPLLGATMLIPPAAPAPAIAARAARPVPADTVDHPPHPPGLRALGWFWGGLALVVAGGVAVLQYLGPPGWEERQDLAAVGTLPGTPPLTAPPSLLLPELPASAPERPALPGPDRGVAPPTAGPLPRTAPPDPDAPRIQALAAAGPPAAAAGPQSMGTEGPGRPPTSLPASPSLPDGGPDLPLRPDAMIDLAPFYAAASRAVRSADPVSGGEAGSDLPPAGATLGAGRGAAPVDPGPSGATVAASPETGASPPGAQAPAGARVATIPDDPGAGLGMVAMLLPAPPAIEAPAPIRPVKPPPMAEPPPADVTTEAVLPLPVPADVPDRPGDAGARRAGAVLPPPAALLPPRPEGVEPEPAGRPGPPSLPAMPVLPERAASAPVTVPAPPPLASPLPALASLPEEAGAVASASPPLPPPAPGIPAPAAPPVDVPLAELPPGHASARLSPAPMPAAGTEPPSAARSEGAGEAPEAGMAASPPPLAIPASPAATMPGPRTPEDGMAGALAAGPPAEPAASPPAAVAAEARPADAAGKAGAATPPAPDLPGQMRPDGAPIGPPAAALAEAIPAMPGDDTAEAPAARPSAAPPAALPAAPLASGEAPVEAPAASVGTVMPPPAGLGGATAAAPGAPPSPARDAVPDPAPSSLASPEAPALDPPASRLPATPPPGASAIAALPAPAGSGEARGPVTAPSPAAVPSGAAAGRPAGTAPAQPGPQADALVRRADALLALGDVSGARLLYGRAAAAGSGRAMLALGKAHDPLFLAEIGVRGVMGDSQVAVGWYRRALSQGVADARERLALHGVHPGD